MNTTHKIPSESTIQKIQKLLALAGNNPNEHERAEAMRRASEMLAEHNLAMSDVQITGSTEAEKATYQELFDSKNFKSWHSVLLEGLTRLNYCKCFKDHKKEAVIIVGTPTAIAAVRSLFTWLSEKLLAEAKSRYSTQAERTAFLIGAAGELQTQAFQRLKQEQAEAVQDRCPGGPAAKPGGDSRANALVRIRSNADADNAAVVKELIGDGKLGASRQQARPKDQSALSAGRQYGRSVNLDKQITDSSSSRRIGAK